MLRWDILQTQVKLSARFQLEGEPLFYFYLIYNYIFKIFLSLGTSEARDILKLIEDRWMSREYNLLSSFTPLTTEKELSNQAIIEDHIVIAKLFIQKLTVGMVCKELQLEKYHACKLMWRFRKNLQTIKIDNRNICIREGSSPKTIWRPCRKLLQVWM